MVSPLKVSSGQFPFHCSLGVSARKARLAGVPHPADNIVAMKSQEEICAKRKENGGTKSAKIRPLPRYASLGEYVNARLVLLVGVSGGRPLQLD